MVFRQFNAQTWHKLKLQFCAHETFKKNTKRLRNVRMLLVLGHAKKFSGHT